MKGATPKNEGGYTYEVATPWNLYPAFQPRSGAELRINIDPSDTDVTDDTQETLLSTSPYRELANPRTFRILALE